MNKDRPTNGWDVLIKFVDGFGELLTCLFAVGVVLWPVSAGIIIYLVLYFTGALP